MIFADEPTGNLDSSTGAVVQQILFDLHRERGITLVVVTHEEDLAGRCDRRVHLRDGRVLAAPVPVGEVGGAAADAAAAGTGAGDEAAVGAPGSAPP